MSDELLRYYNSELSFLRKMGNEFAEAHSAVAGYLKLGSEAEYDPHVARMVQAFAYLNARTRRKLEDDFPEVSASLLEVLYPHYLRPIPSLSIVQFALDRAQADMLDGYKIKRGTMLETLPIEGEPCRFRTAYNVTCWPVQVTEAHLKGLPFTAPQTSFSRKAESALVISLSSFIPEMHLCNFSFRKLRFYLRLSAPFVYDLYELLMNNVLGISIAEKPTDQKPFIVQQTDCVLPVGFAPDEALIDYPARSFPGYRLLTEYLAFPEKYLYFDLVIDPTKIPEPHSACQVFIYFNRNMHDLEPQVSKDTFALGCTPIVNLFKHKAEPIRLTHFDTSSRIIPDSRRPKAFEIYSIDKVIATSRENERKEFKPFYSFSHEGTRSEERYFWHANREWSPGGKDGQDRGTEMFLSICDLDFDPMKPGQFSIDIETTCTNRDLPSRLPFGGGQPRFQIEGGGAVSKITCLTRPTEALRPALRQSTRWRLISHLSLNHISITEETEGATALREILRLYDYRDSADTRRLISGLKAISSRPTVGRVEGGVSGGLCRGVQVKLDFDEEQFTGGGLFLMASVLDRFLGLYAHLNSFTQTVVSTNERGEICRMPARAGEQVLA